MLMPPLVPSGSGFLFPPLPPGRHVVSVGLEAGASGTYCQGGQHVAPAVCRFGRNSPQAVSFSAGGRPGSTLGSHPSGWLGTYPSVKASFGRVWSGLSGLVFHTSGTS